MKLPVIIISILLLTCYNTQATSIKRLPFIDNNVELQIITSFTFGSSSLTCPPFVGFDSLRIDDKLVLNVYYDVSGVWPQLGCELTDTVSLGLLAPAINIIEVVRYEVDHYQGPPDTTVYTSAEQVHIWPVGIEKVTMGEAAIYPNPAKDIVQLRTNEVVKSITVRDIQGRVVKEQKDNNSTVNISSVPPGMYYLYIETEKRRYIEKLIKE